MYRRRGSRGSFRGRCYRSRGQQHMEEMYEVLRFIEHGAHCRQSMDCIRGTLLIRYLKGRRGIGKGELFGWFRQLCVCVDQYHRCRKQKQYRYLNPYSIVVSEEGRLFLLDLEAPENGAVLKQMQKPAVRECFVKPVCEIGAGGQSADIFAYGKTVQFLLAYTQTDTDLTRWEKMRLSRVIARCTGEAGKPYEDIGQVLRDLPAVKETDRGKERSGEADVRSIRRKKKLLAAACACTAVCVLAALKDSGTVSGWEFEERDAGGAALPGDTGLQSGLMYIGEEVDETAVLAVADKILEEYAESEDAETLQGMLEIIQELEIDTVRCLAETYDKLDMEEALETYERLIQIEKDPGKLEDALERKQELEDILGRKEELEQQGTEIEGVEENIP